jgi:hypothetical protein
MMRSTCFELLFTPWHKVHNLIFQIFCQRIIRFCTMFDKTVSRREAHGGMISVQSGGLFGDVAKVYLTIVAFLVIHFLILSRFKSFPKTQHIEELRVFYLYNFDSKRICGPLLWESSWDCLLQWYYLFVLYALQKLCKSST